MTAFAALLTNLQITENSQTRHSAPALSPNKNLKADFFSQTLQPFCSFFLTGALISILLQVQFHLLIFKF